MAEAAGVGMELERELPLRVWLFRLREDERRYVLLLVLHHIAGDGWSLNPLGRDLEEAYGARIKDRDTGVGAIAGAVRGLHAVAAGAAGEREGSGERDRATVGFLEEGAGGDAGRADAADGSNTTGGDELSRGNGGVGGGCGAASRDCWR